MEKNTTGVSVNLWLDTVYTMYTESVAVFVFVYSGCEARTETTGGDHHLCHYSAVS